MGPIRICPQCGIIAPTSKASCAFCNHAFGTAAPVLPPRVDGMVFVCVGGCDFACRGCGLRSSLGGLDVDGEVECRRCGMVQAFDVSQWEEVLGFAHNVADLSNPAPNDPIAQKGPYADIGPTNTWAELKLTGMVIDGGGMKTRTLRLVASPGVPLCLKCKNPLDAALDGNGNAQTRCGRCGETAVYALPSGTSGVYEDLKAAISDDHRTDRQVVKMKASPGGGAVAIACPTCNAPLPASDSTLVTCPFCNTAARIPTRAWYRMVEPEKQQAWWLLFHGPSPARAKLENQRQPLMFDGEDSDDGPAAGDLLAQRLAARSIQQRAQASTQRWIAFAIVMVCLGVFIPVGISIYSAVRIPTPKSNGGSSEPKSKHASKKTDDDDDDDDFGDPLANKKDKDAVIDREKFDTLTGCSCALPSSGPAGKKGAPILQLALRLDAEGKTKISGGPDAGDWLTFNVTWIMDVPGGDPMLLKGDRTDAPSNRVLLHKRGMTIAVACDGANMIVATQKAVSSWSSKDRKRLWSSPLPEGGLLYSGAPASDGLNTNCTTLPVNHDTITVPLAGGKVKKLRVADGSEVH
jgi:hypothetical protein